MLWRTAIRRLHPSSQGNPSDRAVCAWSLLVLRLQTVWSDLAIQTSGVPACR
jgi:hypothetical protein